MPYDPREIEMLRRAIVLEQTKMERRGMGRTSESDEELEGGFIGALASMASRFIPSVVRGATATASRVVPRATSTLSRLPKTLPSVSRTATTTATTAPKTLLQRLTPSLSTTLGVGVPLGFTAYQAVDYEKQKKVAEQQASQAQADTEQMIAEQQRQVDAEVAYLTEQRRLAELERSALEEARTREASAYDQLVRQQEAELLRQAKLDVEYQAQAEKQYAELMRQQQLAIDEAVRRQMEMYRTPAPAPRPPAPRTPAPAPAPAPRTPAPTTGTTARERARARASAQVGGMQGQIPLPTTGDLRFRPPPPPSKKKPNPFDGIPRGGPARPPPPPPPKKKTNPFEELIKERERQREELNDLIRKQGVFIPKGPAKSFSPREPSPARRGEIVRNVMKERGLNLAQASKYVKDNKLY